jgi:3-methyl-2-oxobutanoate hydroxymethyltransferase
LPDVLGLDPDFLPRHALRFANLAQTIQEAATAYREAVANRSFPTEQQSSSINADALREALEGLNS